MFKRRDGSLRDAMEAADVPITSPPRGELAADFRFTHQAVASLDQLIRALEPLSPSLRGMLADLAMKILSEKEGEHDADT